MEIYLMPIGSPEAQEHMYNTLINPVSKGIIKQFVKENTFKEINRAFPENEIAVWGLEPGKNNDSKWKKLKEGDIMIFVPTNENLIITEVGPKILNKKLAKRLWGTNLKTNKTWELIFFVKIIAILNLRKRDFLNFLGYKETYNLQGSTRITKEHMNNFVTYFGSIKEFIDTYSDKKITKDSFSKKFSEDIIKKSVPKDKLLEYLKNKIKNNKTEFISLNGHRIKRNVYVALYVKARAGYKCQACGFTFKKRDGTYYVEAAHIKPLAKSLMDSPENMVALCPNCHKQLDLGAPEVKDKILKKLKII